MGFEKHVFTSYSFGTKLEIVTSEFSPRKKKDVNFFKCIIESTSTKKKWKDKNKGHKSY
jgi:hypothetical protein